ncbi:hypothetical protein K504DRAFT_470957 [Pleomassaria siparia CBS 279.74]|uniref:C2H2-type domain-containing protein n=1 Tax=Pleomassaria siparia CBS 279.74 TaxID=1314801 RepID=A0A6G1K3F2_9PLEO|nr:hypothetical protein K504DRAFT_470957 [Pleomassaria siparia CBS 279.74]
MESDDQLLQFGTPQQSNSFKRPRRSLQGSTPLSSVSESASPSPRLSGQSQLTPEVIDHINGLKHLDDKQILLLLEAARNGDRMRLNGPDRSSMSTIGSRASSYLSVPSSRVSSILSDPRSSIASTDSSFTSYSTNSSRLSTASNRLSTGSSRLSTISTNSSPKNFACTFCDKALKSKPYWKSHEEEFHEQRLTWRCPDCEQIFHAGKRFREHHTKLHGCENCKQPRESGQPTSRKASPCVKKYEIVMHDKDAWGCGFCASLLTTWEERCEHIALHFEEKRSKWNFTNVILGLLKQADVAPSWNMSMSQRHGDQQNWPQLTWESKKCNRLRYKLETKWNTQVFDIEKLVQETYDLAEIEPTDVAEPTNDYNDAGDSTEPTELVDCKLETFDFVPEQQRLQSSHGLPSEASMMDLDPVEPTQNIHHQQSLQALQSLQQPQWPPSTGMAQSMSQSGMNTDDGMSNFGGFNANMNSMATDFSQPVTQGFHQSNWSNAGFVPTPDLVNFQQPPNTYMNYAPSKEVVSVPTSQYANFTQFPRQSVPVNFLHHSGSTGSRRYIPKLINIASSGHRDPQQEQPPPPPPKDEHRFSRSSMRRRPSNISQHTIASQRDSGWHDEVNWG